MKVQIFYDNIDDLKRRGINEVNAIRYKGQNTVVSVAKSSIYEQQMFEEAEELSNEDLLSLDGALSPLPGAGNGVVSNTLILSTLDDSLRIAFWDCKITVTRQHTIVQTALSGQNGSFKEYVQAKDYTIKVTGNLIAESSQTAFPLQELKILGDIFKLKESFKVANVMLNEGFGIYDMCVQKEDYKQSDAKFLNTLPYEIEFVSDVDFDLEVE